MKRFFLLLLLALIWSAGSFAQDTTFTARIVDADTEEALPLVGIYVSEENNTLTNFDGEFSIRCDSSDEVRITCVGRQSLVLQARKLPAVIKMQLLSSTLSEVTVTAVEGILVQVARKMEKSYGKRRHKQAQYFYRQTSIFTQKQDIVEAFITALSANNLRNLQFLTGRHGRLDQAAWNRSNIDEMNLHHLLEIGPLTKDAAFWRSLITPLPEVSAMVSSIDYLQHYYKSQWSRWTAMTSVFIVSHSV